MAIALLNSADSRAAIASHPWLMEMNSKTPGDEYTDKMTTYAQIGVLYYTIYNPDYWQCDKHDPFWDCL